MNASISSIIDEQEDWIDGCIHQVVIQEDPDAPVTVQFDWGRKFKNSRKTDRQALIKVGQECQEMALKYFEELAVGDRFDEELLASS